MIQLKSFLKLLITPVIQNHWFTDLTFFIIRFFCGLMLSLSFGADKFGVPWTADSQHLNLFEVAAWFPEDVKAYGGICYVPCIFCLDGCF